MRVLVTGISSMHGWPIYRLFKRTYPNSAYGIYPLKISSYFKDEENTFGCNIEDFDRLKEIFHKVSPDIVIHAGGVCDLDACEENPELAHEINVGGARNITRLINGGYLAYISSDLVFCGSSPHPKGYNEDHAPSPVSVVGKTYFLAEQEIKNSKNHAIIRIGLPIGDSLPGTKGAIDFIQKRLRNKRKMTLFFDEIRSLIHTNDLAHGILRFVENRVKGLFHFGGPEKYSLYDIGKHLVDTHKYPEKYLIRASRFEEVNGPPRVGDISLDSSRFYMTTGFVPGGPF